MWAVLFVVTLMIGAAGTRVFSVASSCVVGIHDACGYDDGVGVCGVGSYHGCFCRGWRCRRGWFVRHRVVGVLLFQFVNLAPHP